MKITPQSVIAITGASRGIGRQAALTFAKRHASIVLLSRDQSRMEKVSQEIQELGGKPLVLRCDVSNESECHAWVPKALDRFGRIDVLVNNAGFGTYCQMADLPTEILNSTLRTNLHGALWCTQAVLPHMKKQGSGHIVNVSTVISVRSMPFMGVYCLSKAAMNAMTESLLLELKPNQIGVTLLCPGLTATDFQMNAHEINYKAPVSNEKGMSAEKVGRQILKAVEKNKSRVYLTKAGKLLVFLQRLCPRFVDFILYQGMVKRKAFK